MAAIKLAAKLAVKEKKKRRLETDEERKRRLEAEEALRTRIDLAFYNRTGPSANELDRLDA